MSFVLQLKKALVIQSIKRIQSYIGKSKGLNTYQPIKDFISRPNSNQFNSTENYFPLPKESCSNQFPLSLSQNSQSKLKTNTGQDSELLND